MDMYGRINGRKTGRILRKHALYAQRGILLDFGTRKNIDISLLRSLACLRIVFYIYKNLEQYET